MIQGELVHLLQLVEYVQERVCHTGEFSEPRRLRSMQVIENSVRYDGYKTAGDERNAFSDE